MPQRTWKDTKGHHVFPKNVRREVPGRSYDKFTIPLSGKEHVEIHRDIKEYSVIGSLARLDLRRWSKRRKS